MNIYEWEMAHPEPKAPDHRAFNNYAGVLPGMSADEVIRYTAAWTAHRARLDYWLARRDEILADDSRAMEGGNWIELVAIVVLLGIPLGSTILVVILAIMGRI